MLDQQQIISLVVNLCIFVFAIVNTGFLIWQLKFKDKNTTLLFILYIVYWMAPIFTREYTGQMHLHDTRWDKSTIGTFLFIPLIVYGIAGLFWRPLNDIFTFTLQSRKKIIFISIGLQFVCIVPFLAYPCFATNIIQSIGAGIGASAIGLFNMMFDESYHHKKIFATVSIITLPPLIAEFISSVMEAILMTFLPLHAEGEQYTSVVWYVWVFALVFIIAAFVMTFFLKEKKEMLYTTNIVREPVKRGSDWAIIAFMSIIAIGISFVRWATAGPTSTTQLIWVGEHKDPESGGQVDTRFFEGYLSLIYAFGIMVGMIITIVTLNKFKSKQYSKKLWLFIIAIALWMIYLGVTTHFPIIWIFLGMNFVNGLAYGIVWNIVTGIMMKKIFTKTNIITPMGVFNTFLSIGICLGTLMVNMVKGEIFSPHTTNVWETFVNNNKTCNMWTAIVVCIMLISFIIVYILEVECPTEPVKVEKKLAVQSETEI